MNLAVKLFQIQNISKLKKREKTQMHMYTKNNEKVGQNYAERICLKHLDSSSLNLSKKASR